MNRDICDLIGFPEKRLFEEIAEGIPLIVQNAENLDEVANRLSVAGEYRASEIIRGFAEEEAAKVLILLDVVRCPPTSGQRESTLNGFNSHLAKRIYAMTCSRPDISKFGELRKLVKLECKPYYLEGPNSVDWIVPNSIVTERERTIYVDYVHDITDSSSVYFWSSPEDGGYYTAPYRRPESVSLCRALCDAGADSADGLAVIADAWRGLVPSKETGRPELRERTAKMLDRLGEGWHSRADAAATRFIMSCWSFPLWPLSPIKSPARNKSLDQLRKERDQIIKWIEDTEAKREPRPAIDRPTVESMSNAFSQWWSDIEKENVNGSSDQGSRIQSRKASEIAKDFELPSYYRMKAMFEELNDGERTALLALAWFIRDRVANWPRVFEQASARLPTLDDGYQLGLGGDWLAGLNRYEEEPEEFKAGRWYRPNRDEE